MSLSPGTRLGPYEILSALAAGGMGKVYRARTLASIAPSRSRSLPAPFAAVPDRLSTGASQ